MAGSHRSRGLGQLLTARPVGIVDGVDFEHTGVVRKVDSAAIRRAIDFDAMVLLSPFGFSPTGEAFNLTMEDVAPSTAIALQADKLIYVTEVRGIPLNPTTPTAAIDTELALADAERLLGRAAPGARSPPTPRSTCSIASRPARAASSAGTSCRSRWTGRC